MQVLQGVSAGHSASQVVFCWHGPLRLASTVYDVVAFSTKYDDVLGYVSWYSSIITLWVFYHPPDD